MQEQMQVRSIKNDYIAKTEELSDVIEFVESELDLVGVSMKVNYQIQLAIEEIFVNVCHYAYPTEPGRVSLTIEYDPSKSQFTFIFADTGFPFNPLEMEDPDISLSADDRKAGGLGVFLVKKIMNEVNYVYEDKHNILRLVKKI